MRGGGTSVPDVTPRTALVREGQAVVVLPVFLALLFGAMVLFLRAFEPAAAGFDRRGAMLVLYHVARVGLTGFLAVLCYAAGYRVLELVSLSPLRVFAGARTAAIACFFLGASLYGIAFSVLGLAGAINLATALALTVPVLLASYRPLQALVAGRRGSARADAWADAQAPRFLVTFVVSMTALAALLFVLTRVLFIAVFDPNIWEHYVHYYRAVLASGSTQPNEVWHHFYASKGAGLILLANALSDFFGAQLASACFAIAAALIVFAVLREHGVGAGWTWFGVMLLLAFLIGQVADGAPFKHHMVLLGYAAFAFWGCLQLRRATGSEHRALLAVLLVSLGYFGFYVPAAAAVFPLAFVLVAAGSGGARNGRHRWSLLALAAAVCAGGGVAFVTNWAITGLAEVTPMRWFWAVADQARAERLFGLGGIEFFLARNNDLSATYDWTLARTWRVLRYPLRMDIVLVGLLIGVGLLVRERMRGGPPEPARAVAYAAAFAMPLALFAQAVQSESVTRMGLYSIVFTTVALVIALKATVDAAAGLGVSPRLARPVASENAGAVGGYVRRGVRRAVSPAVLVTLVVLGGMTLATLDAWKKTRRERPVIPAFAAGRVSLKESFEWIETRAKGLPVGIGVAEMTRFRRDLPAGERILRLTYDGGFAYALPGDGLVSEPTYALIRDPAALLDAEPEEVIAYLVERGITHLTLNLHNNLFSTIAFTPLLDPARMPAHVHVVHEDGDRFILAWRQGRPGERPPSAYLLTLLELKRTGVLHHPFSAEVEARLTAGEDEVLKSVAEFQQARREFLAGVDAIGAEMLSRLSLETGRGVVRRALAAGRAAVLEREPQTAGGRLRALLGPDASWPLTERTRDRALRVTLLSRFRDAVHREYVADLGTVIAWLSVRCDERVPFAREYPPDAGCIR